MRYSLLLPTAVLAGALAVGCGDNPGVTDTATDGPVFAAAETSTNVFVVDVDFTEPLLCTNEAIHWTGTTRIVEHITANRGYPLNPGGPWQHEVSLQSVRLTGVGETSGGTYRFIGTFNQSIQGPSPVNDYPVAITLTNRDKIFGPEGGLLGIGMFSVSLVINGAGELVHEDVDFTGQCR
jgi:hypothetical protein